MGPEAGGRLARTGHDDEGHEASEGLDGRRSGPGLPRDGLAGRGVERLADVLGVDEEQGNPTRTYYGEGSMPRAPEVAWRFSEEKVMCGASTIGRETEEHR